MQLAEAAQDEAAFSMRALRHLASRANLAVSPLSLHAALALLAAGARAGTLHEIASFLGPAGGNAHAALASYIALSVFADSGGEGGSGNTVRFANGVWATPICSSKLRSPALSPNTTAQRRARRSSNPW